MISKRGKVELISARMFTKTFVDERPETLILLYRHNIITTI